MANAARGLKRPLGAPCCPFQGGAASGLGSGDNQSPTACRDKGHSRPTGLPSAGARMRSCGDRAAGDALWFLTQRRLIQGVSGGGLPPVGPTTLETEMSGGKGCSRGLAGHRQTR